MRNLLMAICVLVFILLGASFYFAGKSFDGVVDHDYYHAASHFFAAREEEKRLGFSILLPGSLSAGRNIFRVGLSLGDTPLTGARVSLIVRGLGAPRVETGYVLNESEPGMYRSDVVIPSSGRWLFNLDIASPTLTTSRTWMATVE